MENEQVITEYNENKEVPILADVNDGGNTGDENFNQEEKTFEKSNVRVTITELKGGDPIQNDYI
jgi:hypothetical protein